MRLLTIVLLLLATSTASAQPMVPRAPWADPGLADRLDDALGKAERSAGDRGADVDRGGRDARREPRSNREGGLDVGGAVDLVTAFVLTCVVVILIALVTTWMWRQRGLDRDAPATVSEPAERELSLARACMDADDPAGVVAACYRFAIHVFRSRGLMPEADGLADTSILRRLAHDGLHSPFLTLSRAFQPLRYGGREPAKDDARSALASAEQINDAVKAKGATA